MLYVFHGTDVAQAGEKARALVKSLRAKKPDAAYERMDADSWSAAAIEGHLGGQGLFSNKYIVFLDRVTENAEAKDSLPGMVASLEESSNIFIVLEGKLNAELKRAVEKSAEKVIECVPKTAEQKEEGPNIFALAGAFGNRDVPRAWKLYRDAINGGAAPEAIVGMLFWKAKSMGAKGLAHDLMVMYHDAHRGVHDLELATERCILGLAR